MWVSLTTPDRSSVRGIYLNRGEGLTFLFENSGAAAAVLLNASITFPPKEGRVWRGGAQSVLGLADRVIGQGAVLEVCFDRPQFLPPAVAEVLEPGTLEATLDGFARDELCDAQFVFGEVDGRATDLTISFPCWHYAVEARRED